MSMVYSLIGVPPHESVIIALVLKTLAKCGSLCSFFALVSSISFGIDCTCKRMIRVYKMSDNKFDINLVSQRMLNLKYCHQVQIMLTSLFSLIESVSFLDNVTTRYTCIYNY